MQLNKQNLFNNSEISEEQFLREYWHKKPLLIRNAFNQEDLKDFPDKKQLQQLSCREDIQSRIVFKNGAKDYSIEYGPFIESDFDEIDEHCWNLLVSDIDKWRPESQKPLKAFQFIRNWLFDDLMLSCGKMDGTVGPHTDNYDVFLLQSQGQRQWQYGPVSSNSLLPNLEIKVLADFKAENRQTLNPGDVLYLPPGIAHFGEIASDDCVTCSIGLRTPSESELLTSYVDYLAQRIPEQKRFNEPDFSTQPNCGEFKQKDLNQVAEILDKNIILNNKSLQNWFGKYITEYRSLFYEFNDSDSTNKIINCDLIPNPFSKYCYYKKKQKAKLFVNGIKYKTSLKLAKLICNDKRLQLSAFLSLTLKDKSVVEDLYNNHSLIKASL
jgi:50S ribosomal protein L16 3-hydroxylase